MKLKYLMIVSLILAIITIGAVSAADASDELAADDSQDSIADSVDENVVSGSDDVDDGYDFYIADEVDTNVNSASPIANVYDDEGYFNGTITLSIDNTQYFKKSYSSDDYEDDCNIYASDLTLPDSLKSGSHNIVLSYLKNGVSTPYTYSQTSNFIYAPEICPSNIISSVGTTAYVFIEHISGSSGTATLYNYDENTGTIGSVVSTVPISDGKARIAIGNLAQGYYDYYLNMTINGKTFGKTFEVNVIENEAGYSAGVSSSITSGSDATVSFSGPKGIGMVGIIVDGNEFKALYYEGNALNEPISGLTVGEHIISVIFMHGVGKYSYSNSFTVNVKAPAVKDTISLVLKAVKVKKSAKKLVLKATLKINKKAVKGKKITFKFNGKKYTAKTNKNGVAKVTIKKKVLNKLKVGKKVTYTAQYSTKTAKKTAKVKK